jgi:DNA-binding transcriptional MocR family regulator
MALTLKHYKETWDICTNSLSQAIVSEFLRNGAYRRHLNRVRRTYRERRDTMMAALDASLGSTARFTNPKGGMHIWVMLETAVNMSRLEERAAAQGIIFAPSNLFFHDGRKTSAFRLNFTANDPATIREGINRLSSVIKQEIKK